MSKIYDNWERLVGAVLRKQQLWELFHEQSRSPSMSSGSSDFSFACPLNSSLDDVPFTFSRPEKEESVTEVVYMTDFTAAFDPDDIGGKKGPGNHSRISVMDQFPVVPVNLSSNGNASSSFRRKKNLNIQVPKLHSENCLNIGPRMTSTGPVSRTHRRAVSQLHPRVGRRHSEPDSNWLDLPQSHPLPLPPATVANNSPPFSHLNSAVASPSAPLSPGRIENPGTPGSHWKKGKLLRKGSFGSIYVGFNSETGEMCAMKEVPLYVDGAKSKLNSKQLAREIALLSSLKHPNIVQYYGSEMVHDKFFIYLEYVTGGSIHVLVKQYGNLGESTIRIYTQQILSGLAYLHSKNTVHRNIKGANIFVDPNGCIKLANFGMAKRGSQVAGQSPPLLFTGSPYWMPPEVIRNTHVCNQATDIWSLGCTVLEMVMSKPPWSQYEEAVAMFKIAHRRELPVIPDSLSEECKDFVKKCLQWNPLQRPTASQLLEHPFVKSVMPLEKQIPDSKSSDHVAVTNAVKSVAIDHVRLLPQLESERLGVHSSGGLKSTVHSSEIYIPRNFSSPVSPVGMPLQHPRSPQNLSKTASPSPISSPNATSGSSTPITGGIGAIPYQHSNQSMLLPMGFYDPSKHTSSPSVDSPSYWDPYILQRVLLGSHAFRELSYSKNYAIGQQSSPSLISSPSGTSGSSTPITDGIGAISYQHSNQSILLPMSFYDPSKRTSSPSVDSPSYWDPYILQRVLLGSHAFRELSYSNNYAIGQQFGKVADNGELYDGRSISAGGVSATP